MSVVSPSSTGQRNERRFHSLICYYIKLEEEERRLAQPLNWSQAPKDLVGTAAFFLLQGDDASLPLSAFA